MATVRLHNVSKVFRGDSSLPKGKRVKREEAAARIMRQELPQRSGPVTALDHVSLTVPDGTTLAVVGPSGCGKSTLLRVIAGLVDYEGDVLYDEQNVRDIPVKERYIGMVFQSYALYPHFEGEGNLRFFFNVRKAPDAEAEERIRVTSEIMGIGFRELLRRKPGKLSGGQRQRVAIARALVRQPRLFLFDEPLSNLDAKLRVQTRHEIKRLLHRFGITAIYVTHDQVEATAIGDEIAVMRQGRIEQVGTFQDLQRDPRNAFVAGFFGLPPMNLLRGTIAGDVLRLGAEHIPLLPAVAARCQEGQSVILGIRPDVLELYQPDGSALRGPCFEATVDMVEPDYGRHRQLAHVHTGELKYSVIASMETRLTPGYTVDVVFPRESMYFFDAKTESRIEGQASGGAS